MTITFKMAIKKCVKFFRLFHFTKVLTKPILKGSASLSNILHSTINFSSSYNINKTSFFFAPLAVCPQAGCSAFPFCTLTKPFIRLYFKYKTVLIPKLKYLLYILDSIIKCKYKQYTFGMFMKS